MREKTCQHSTKSHAVHLQESINQSIKHSKVPSQKASLKSITKIPSETDSVGNENRKSKEKIPSNQITKFNDTKILRRKKSYSKEKARVFSIILPRFNVMIRHHHSGQGIWVILHRQDDDGEVWSSSEAAPPMTTVLASCVRQVFAFAQSAVSMIVCSLAMIFWRSSSA